MPLEAEIKQQELNRKPFFSLGMEPHFSWHSRPSGLSLGCFPQLGSLLRLHRVFVVALSLKLFFHAPRYMDAVLPTHQLSRHAICHQCPEFKPSSSNSAQTLPRVKFMTPLLWFSWLVPERSSRSGFAFAEEKVTAPATGGRRGHIS